MNNKESNSLMPHWQKYSLLATFGIGVAIGGYLLPKEVESKNPAEVIDLNKPSSDELKEKSY